VILATAHLRPARRLHSLSGILPLGAFLIWHLGVNATAMLGAARYDEVASTIARIPWVRTVEVVVIGVPLVLHVVFGALIGNTEAATARPRVHLTDRWVAIQRGSGAIVVAFVLFHVWSTRFSHEPSRIGSDLFGFLVHHLSEGAVRPFYCVGVIAIGAHFGVGLYDFAHQWGLAASPAAARRWARGSGAASVALTIVGIATVAALR
jgi:succinate dehydrogenase / fumarate reductase cytochrome b subunit